MNFEQQRLTFLTRRPDVAERVAEALTFESPTASCEAFAAALRPAVDGGRWDEAERVFATVVPAGDAAAEIAMRMALPGQGLSYAVGAPASSSSLSFSISPSI